MLIQLLSNEIYKPVVQDNRLALSDDLHSEAERAWKLESNLYEKNV